MEENETARTNNDSEEEEEEGFSSSSTSSSSGLQKVSSPSSANRKRPLRLYSSDQPETVTTTTTTSSSSTTQEDEQLYPRTRSKASSSLGSTQNVTSSSSNSPDDSSGDNSEGGGTPVTTGKKSPAKTRPTRKGRFLKGTTLMASLKVKQNGGLAKSKVGRSPVSKPLKGKEVSPVVTVPATGSGATGCTDNTEDMFSNVLSSIPDVGICSFSEEVDIVNSSKRKKLSHSPPADTDCLSPHKSNGGSKLSDEDSDPLMSPEIDLQNKPTTSSSQATNECQSIRSGQWQDTITSTTETSSFSATNVMTPFVTSRLSHLNHSLEGVHWSNEGGTRHPLMATGPLILPAPDEAHNVSIIDTSAYPSHASGPGGKGRGSDNFSLLHRVLLSDKTTLPNSSYTVPHVTGGHVTEAVGHSSRGHFVYPERPHHTNELASQLSVTSTYLASTLIPGMTTITGSSLHNAGITSTHKGITSPVLSTHQRITSTHGGITSTHGGINPAHVGINLAHGGINPAHVGINPAHVGINPAHGGINPAHVGINPAHVGINPAHGGINPAHGGITSHFPSLSGLTSPNTNGGLSLPDYLSGLSSPNGLTSFSSPPHFTNGLSSSTITHSNTAAGGALTSRLAAFPGSTSSLLNPTLPICSVAGPCSHSSSSFTHNPVSLYSMVGMGLTGAPPVTSKKPPARRNSVPPHSSSKKTERTPDCSKTTAGSRRHSDKHPPPHSSSSKSLEKPPRSRSGGSKKPVFKKPSVSSSEGFLHVNSEWRDSLQVKMKELLQNKAITTSSSPTLVMSSHSSLPDNLPPPPALPTSSSHVHAPPPTLPPPKKSAKPSRGCTNKLTRPPMKANPPSVLKGRGSPHFNVSTPHSSPPFPLAAAITSCLFPPDHVDLLGLNPFSASLLSLLSGGAGFACLDAINYAELERQYRCAQTILETQQLHVNNLKNRLIQARFQQQVLLLNSDHYQRCSKNLALPTMDDHQLHIPVSIPGYKTSLEDSISPNQWKGSFEKPQLECLDFYNV